jgi:hypothetical protein
MSDGYHHDDETDLPVLEEVIRPAPEPNAEVTGVPDGPGPTLQAKVSAIIERHAREAIEEISALLEPHEDDGGG